MNKPISKDDSSNSHLSQSDSDEDTHIKSPSKTNQASYGLNLSSKSRVENSVKSISESKYSDLDMMGLDIKRSADRKIAKDPFSKKFKLQRNQEASLFALKQHISVQPKFQKTNSMLFTTEMINEE